MGISVDENNGNLIIKPNLPREINTIKLHDFKFKSKIYDIEIDKDGAKITKITT